MVRLRLTYQCFNGENNTKKLKILSEIYKNLPVDLEFRLPDGSSYSAGNVLLDENGKAEYLIPRDILIQNGNVYAQATVKLTDGRIEKSSIISFNVVNSINADDDFAIILRNKRLYPLGGNSVSFVGDNSNYKLRFVGIENLGNVFAVFRKDGQKSDPVLIDEEGYALVPSWVLKMGTFEVGLRADGFASSALEMSVERSIVNEKDVLHEPQDASVAEQLLIKVNSIKWTKGAVLRGGHLILIQSDGSEIDCGYIQGSSGGSGGSSMSFAWKKVFSGTLTEERKAFKFYTFADGTPLKFTEIFIRGAATTNLTGSKIQELNVYYGWEGDGLFNAYKIIAFIPKFCQAEGTDISNMEFSLKAELIGKKILDRYTNAPNGKTVTFESRDSEVNVFTQLCFWSGGGATCQSGSWFDVYARYNGDVEETTNIAMDAQNKFTLDNISNSISNDTMEIKYIDEIPHFDSAEEVESSSNISCAETPAGLS